MKSRWSIKVFLLCFSVVCLAILVTPNASAVTPKEVLRIEHNQTFQGFCCFSWFEAVQVIEPSSVIPVLVTWSTDYQATGPFLVGLSVNGGFCNFFGSGSIEPFGKGDGTGASDSRTFQWFILPDEGLVRGRNTFTLCGGAIFSASAVIVVGFNTLTVRTTK